MTFLLRRLVLLKVLALSILAAAPAVAQTPISFTLISQVMEANTRVVALSIDFGKDLPLSWRLERHFSVQAELLPVKSYAGDVIANSAAAKAPRTIRKAYTRASPEMGSPSQGRYVIIEMDPDDFNASSWYVGFNPGIRQLLPYNDNMRYEVTLLHDLNYVTPNISPDKPGSDLNVVKAGSTFKQSGSRIATADQFAKGVFELPNNPQTKAIGYAFYKPADLPAGAKVPLVVFLHGSGQSHDYKHFPSDMSADVLSPLLTNQGGVTWVERGPEKAFVLVPQAPARDTADPAGENGWRSADTQRLLLSLVDKLIVDHPAIDTRRLYLTGLSMGAMGSWAIITHKDPAISRKFAAAALFNGISLGGARLATLNGETPAAKESRVTAETKGVDYSSVSIPVWLGHADTDPVLSKIGSRIPFAMLTGKATLDATGATFQVEPGTLKNSDSLVRHYVAPNQRSGAEVRYSEYQYGNGNRFRDLGMVTRNGHFSWEVSYKDQAIIDWMFRQSLK
jgi:predicted peptidase